MWLLYQSAVVAALALLGPVLLLARGRHYLASLRQRLGFYADAPVRRGGTWIHAVSVGEVGVAATLAPALPDGPLLLTTVTPTGQNRAHELFAAGTDIAYLPFELGFAIARFLGRFEPRRLILVEGDLWPLLLARVKRRSLPVAVVNGRVGDRSFRRQRRLGPLCRLLYEPVDRFAVQTAQDADRLAALGVASERIAVTGNVKYDSPPPPRLPALERWVQARAGGREILVAGSTMAGEESEVVAAWRRAGPTRALLLLAPRHPERWPAVAAELAASGIRLARRSELGSAAADVVLLDSMGELAALYRLGAAAFVGGSLVPSGGHNPIEPARFAVPVAAGPSMENFREIAAQFDAAGAWLRAADGADLGRIWRRWLEHADEAREVGRRAERLVARHQGALDRTAAFVAPLWSAAGGA